MSVTNLMHQHFKNVTEIKIWLPTLFCHEIHHYRSRNAFKMQHFHSESLGTIGKTKSSRA